MKYIFVEIVVINFILIKNIKNTNYFVKQIKLKFYYHHKINIFNFKNLQNTIQHNFICYADIESQMIFNDNVYEHEHLMSGYYLHCIDPKYSKKVKLFDNLEDFRDNLINELDYIKNINKYKLNFDIDMNNFNKKEFDKIEKCKHCDQKFNEDYNNRKITLIEKVDKYKLKELSMILLIMILMKKLNKI